jgi:hypothetical protein
MDNIQNSSHTWEKFRVYNRYNSEILNNWEVMLHSLVCIEHRIQLAPNNSHCGDKIAEFGTAFAEFCVS